MAWDSSDIPELPVILQKWVTPRGLQLLVQDPGLGQVNLLGFDNKSLKGLKGTSFT